MKKTMTICGKTFEFCGKTGCKEYVTPSRYSYENINKAYDRPSITKQIIWQDWVNWHNRAKFNGDIIGGHIWISSRNTRFFTISGHLTIEDPTTGAIENYEIQITAKHNRIWLCEV